MFITRNSRLYICENIMFRCTIYCFSLITRNYSPIIFLLFLFSSAPSHFLIALNLTARRRVILEKLIVAYVPKKFPAFYET
jgi:hypothetical protein